MDIDTIHELLEDVEIGNFIQITFGKDSPQIESGQVCKMTNSLIKLETEEGAVKILLESIVGVKMLKDKPQQEVPVKQQSEEHKPSDNYNTSCNFQSNGTLTRVRLEQTLQSIHAIGSISFQHEAVLKNIQNTLKLTGNQTLYKQVNAVIDSLNNAVKCNSLNDKFHNIKSKIIAMSDLCLSEEEWRMCDLLLGVLCICAKEYNLAIDPLVRSKHYAFAAYSAQKAQDNENYSLYCFFALLSGEAFLIDNEMISFCVKHQDISALLELMHNNISNHSLDSHFFACAVSVLYKSGHEINLPNNWKEDCATALQLLDTIPPEWRTEKPCSVLNQWKKSFDFSYLDAQNSEGNIESQEYISTILDFKEERLFGFIKHSGSDHFFHIRQVKNDDNLLRWLLAENKYEGIEISYYLGTNNNGTCVATDIILTEKGRKEAEQRLAKKESLSGFVNNYKYNDDLGWISSGDNVYTFKSTGIIDPWLKAYYGYNFQYEEQDVLFDLSSLNGKIIAINVRFKEELSESERQMLTAYFNDKIEKEEKDAWRRFLEEQNKDGIDLSKDPFEECPFISLPDWEGDNPQSAYQQPFRLNLKTDKKIEAFITPSIKYNNNISDAVKYGTPVGNDELYEKAHRLLLAQKLKEAEGCYLDAINANVRIESSVADLIGIYMRQPERIPDALKLLEDYGQFLNADKAINLEISVCQKAKNYERLCELYQEVMQRTNKVSVKAHSLINMAIAQRMLKRYDDALKTYSNWHDLQSQYRNTAEGLKMNKTLIGVQRGEALCYYFLGQKEKADEIATALLRINPSDMDAICILNNTLTEDLTDNDDGILFNEPTDTNNESDAILNKFILDKVHNINNIARVIKSKYVDVETGEYVGNEKQAESDLSFLIEKIKGVTSKQRSDYLFAAASIIDYMQQKYPEGCFTQKEWAENKNKYIGRAIASWGDFIVTDYSFDRGSYQNDTPRFAFLSAINLLKLYEQDWQNSYNRYLKSYYYSQEELRNYIWEQTRSRSNEKANDEILKERNLPDSLYSEFLVGMIQLLDVLKGDKYNKTVNSLYSSNKLLRAGLIQQLGQLLELQVSDEITSLSEFRSQLQSAQELLRKRRETLQDILDNCAHQLMSPLNLQKHLDGLRNDYWKISLTATDFERLNRIEQFMRRMLDYNLDTTFDHRADCLHDAIHSIDELNEQIMAEPTLLSYENYSPALQTMRDELSAEEIQLYKVLTPKLTWEENIPPYVSPDNRVRIHLVAKNEKNRQTADTLQIIKISGDDILDWHCEHSIAVGLRGNESDEAVLSVVLTPTARQTGSFTLTLTYSYQYNSAPQTFTPTREEFSQDFTLYIHTEHQSELENPYSSHVGSEMYDVNMFYGRDNEIESITKSIFPADKRPNYGHAIAMYGQTRAGKTSILFHLKKHLITCYKSRVLLWDMQNIAELSIQGNYLSGFLYTMLSCADDDMRDNHPDLYKALADAGIQNPKDIILEKPEQAQLRFTNYMRGLDRIIRTQFEGTIVVLMIDEFTHLHTQLRLQTIPTDFMKFWKAFLQNYCVFAVVAGQDDMPEFITSYQNEFACMDTMKITYLKDVPAKRLIKEPLERANREGMFMPEDATLNELYQLTAGSAYLIISICSALVEYMKERGAHTVTPAIISDFLKNSAFKGRGCLDETTFEPQLKDRSKMDDETERLNKQILLSIARLSHDTGRAPIDKIKCEGLDRAEIQKMLHRLLERNVLERVDSNSYKIEVELLTRWLLETEGM